MPTQPQVELIRAARPAARAPYAYVHGCVEPFMFETGRYPVAGDGPAYEALVRMCGRRLVEQVRQTQRPGRGRGEQRPNNMTHSICDEGIFPSRR